MTEQSFRGQFFDVESVLRFMFAGNATLTLRSKVTGDEFTYKIEEGKKNPKFPRPLYFVKVLNGPDNESNYGYLGTIRSNKTFVWGGVKAVAGETAPSVAAFRFAMEFFVAKGCIPSTLEVWHEERCGRCGRKLTVATSVATGFGPECCKIMGISQVQLNITPAHHPRKTVAQRESAVQPIIHTTQAKPTPSASAINAMIEQKKADDPEGYFMDGELDEKQAREFWSKRFAIQPYEAMKGVA